MIHQNNISEEDVLTVDHLFAPHGISATSPSCAVLRALIAHMTQEGKTVRDENMAKRRKRKVRSDRGSVCFLLFVCLAKKQGTSKQYSRMALLIQS